MESADLYLSLPLIINFIVLLLAIYSTVVITRKYKTLNLPFYGIANNYIIVFITICVLRLICQVMEILFLDSKFVRNLILVYLPNICHLDTFISVKHNVFVQRKGYLLLIDSAPRSNL